MSVTHIRVLLLDDDEDDIFLISDTIEEIPGNNYSIFSCHTIKDAWKLIAECKPDIVLCDNLLGGSTGVEFIKATRQRGIDTPFILLTGAGDKATDEAALKAGAADFINKTNLNAELLDRAIRYSIANAHRQRLFHSILQNVNAGLVMIDDAGTPVIWNPEFAELAAHLAESASEEEAVAEFTARMIKADRIVTIHDKVLEKKISEVPGDGRVILLQDVTEHIKALREREAAELRAAHLAMNCSLTGLPNRNAFTETIESEIERAQSLDAEFFLLNLDLNKFKEVNDVHGHHVGDELLAAVSARLRSCCGEDDYVARLGGDEFMAIQRKPRNGERTSSLAKKFAAQFKEPFELDGMQIVTGVSIGVATYPQNGTGPEELMSKADVAMYKAKSVSYTDIQIFDEEMDRRVREARQLGHDLRVAVERGDIEVFYQPQADMVNRRIIGFEALARWNHPVHGPIPPSLFIPIAEDSGLIGKLGVQVLEEACRMATSWDRDTRVAVNISPAQIRNVDLVQQIHTVLLKTGLSPHRLELEVTESILIDDKSRALHVLRGIKDLGITIALDDFGTGYSSLSTLISFPFDKVKIDRSFVEKIGKNHQASIVTQTIIKMTDQLGYRVIAEGVQTSLHVDFLLKEGCQEMQGFLIGKPLPAKKIKNNYSIDNFRHQNRIVA